MSTLSGKSRKRKNLHFIRLIVLFFTIKIQFVHSEIDIEGNNNNAVLLQKSVLSGKLSTGKFNGKEVTALAYNFPPQFTYTKLKDGNYTFAGSIKEHLDEVVTYLNMSLKYIIMDPAIVTKYGFNGALYHYVNNKMIDFVPTLRYQRLETSKLVELVTALWIDPFVLLQPFPDEESHLDVTKRPFQPMVWLSFFGTTVVFVLISATIIKNRMDIDADLNSNHQSLRQTIFNQLDYVLRHITNQGSSGTHSKTRTSFRILTGIWLLSMVVLINGYAGVLTSLLTVPKLNPIAQTLKDVAESKELRVTCEKNSYFSDMFLSAKEGYEKILGDQLRNDPTLLLSEGSGALAKVLSHKAAYPGPKSLPDLMVYIDTKMNGHCRMTTSKPLVVYSTMAMQIVLPIGSPYAAIYSEVTLRLWANGMIVNLHKKDWKTTDRCRVDKPPKTKTRVLTMTDLSPAFLILGVGFSLSGFGFAMEVLSKYIFASGLRTREINTDDSKPTTKKAGEKKGIEIEQVIDVSTTQEEIDWEKRGKEQEKVLFLKKPIKPLKI